MAKTLIQEYGINASRADKAVSGITQLLKKHGLSLDQLTKITGIYNDKAKAQELIIQALDKSGRTLTASLKVNSSGWEVNTEKITANTSAKRANVEATKQMESAQQRLSRLTQKFVALGPKPGITYKDDLTEQQKQNELKVLRVVLEAEEKKKTIRRASAQEAATLAAQEANQKIANEEKVKTVVENAALHSIGANRRRRAAEVETETQRLQGINRQAYAEKKAADEAIKNYRRQIAEMNAAVERGNRSRTASRIDSQRITGLDALRTKPLLDAFDRVFTTLERVKTGLGNLNSALAINVPVPAGIKQRIQFLTQLEILQNRLAANQSRSMGMMNNLLNSSGQDFSKLSNFQSRSTSQSPMDRLLKGGFGQGQGTAQIDKLNQAFQNLGMSGQTAGQKVMLSWQNVARVMQFTLVYGAIYKLLGAFKQAIHDSAQFSVKIAEIQTISLRANVSFGEWSKGIKQLSDQFGVPIFQTIEGTYQAISNQVAKGKDAFTFMNEAVKLSIITTESLDAAVNTSTAVINAFHLEVSQAAYVNAILFKTVEVGRVRLGEMANDLGRVSNLSRELGVTFEEQQAALAELTIQGIKFDTSQTLLTNIMQKLIRPSKEMSRLFKEWGVTSGEAAIKTFGFFGLLKKFEEAAKSSGDELAELGQIFINVRATTGGAALLGNLDRMNNTLVQFKGAASDAAEAMKIVQENTGKKLQIELNKVKNLFTVTFGEEIIRRISLFTGGIDNIAATIKTLINVAIKAVEVFVIWKGTMAAIGLATSAYNIAIAANIVMQTGMKAAMLGSAAAAATLKAAMGDVISLLVAAGSIAFVLWINSAEDFAQAMEDAGQKALASSQKINQAFKDKIDIDVSARINKFKDNVNEIFQPILRNIANIGVANNRLVNELESQFKVLGKLADLALRAPLKSASDEISKLKKQADSALDGAKKAAKEAAELREDASIKKFRMGVEGKKPGEKVDAFTKEAERLRALALATLGDSGKSPEARLEESKRLIDLAKDYEKNAEQELKDIKSKLNKDVTDEDIERATEAAEKKGRVLEKAAAGIRDKFRRSASSGTFGAFPFGGTPKSVTRSRRSKTPFLGEADIMSLEDKLAGATGAGDKLKELEAEKIANATELKEIKEKIAAITTRELKTTEDLAKAHEKVAAELKKTGELKEAKAGEKEAALEKFKEVLAELDAFKPEEDKESAVKFSEKLKAAEEAAKLAGIGGDKSVDIFRQHRAMAKNLENMDELIKKEHERKLLATEVNDLNEKVKTTKEKEASLQAEINKLGLDEITALGVKIAELGKFFDRGSFSGIKVKQFAEQDIEKAKTLFGSDIFEGAGAGRQKGSLGKERAPEQAIIKQIDLVDELNKKLQATEGKDKNIQNQRDLQIKTLKEMLDLLNKAKNIEGVKFDKDGNIIFKGQEGRGLTPEILTGLLGENEELNKKTEALKKIRIELGEMAPALEKLKKETMSIPNVFIEAANSAKPAGDIMVSVADQVNSAYKRIYETLKDIILKQQEIAKGLPGVDAGIPIIKPPIGPQGGSAIPDFNTKFEFSSRTIPNAFDKKIDLPEKKKIEPRPLSSFFNSALPSDAEIKTKKLQFYFGWLTKVSDYEKAQRDLKERKEHWTPEDIAAARAKGLKDLIEKNRLEAEEGAHVAKRNAEMAKNEERLNKSKERIANAEKRSEAAQERMLEIQKERIQKDPKKDESKVVMNPEYVKELREQELAEKARKLLDARKPQQEQEIKDAAERKIRKEKEFQEMIKRDKALLDSAVITEKVAEAEKSLIESIEEDYEKLLEKKKDALKAASNVEINGAHATANALQSVINQQQQIIQNNYAIAQSAGATSNTPGFGSKGGLVSYLAGGGFPGTSRGQDTKPAWLNPFEYVVNAQSSKQFLPLLKAMNQGGSGGVSGSTNFGDINITVNGGSTSTQTVKSMVHELRREIRRGTLKL